MLADHLFGSALLALALLLAAPASAQVYKCTDAAGQVVFSDQPCGQGQRRELLNPRDNSLDTSGEREQALKNEIRELRTRLDKADAGTAPASAQNAARADTDTQHGRTDRSDRTDSSACEEARNRFEIAAGAANPNVATLQARRSLMHAACGLPEPTTPVADPTPKPPPAYRPRTPSLITACDATGCWDNRGWRYTRGGGNTFYGVNGSCQRVGNAMVCP
jgi:hypothetical protein